MATALQIAANQRNAQRSTGPRTEEGKTIARANSLKHGLSSQVIAPEVDGACENSEKTCKSRLDQWAPDVTVKTPYHAYQLQELVDASIAVDRCKKEGKLRRKQLAKLARANGQAWKDQQKRFIARLAKSLKRNPQEVSLQLRSTPEGRAWLIEEWDRLEILVREGERPLWTDRHSNHALDLMGKPKSDREAYLKRNNLLQTSRQIRAEIAAQIAELRELCKADAEETEQARRIQAGQMGFENDATLNFIGRCEASARRTFNRALRELRKPVVVPEPKVKAPKLIQTEVLEPEIPSPDVEPSEVAQPEIIFAVETPVERPQGEPGDARESAPETEETNPILGAGSEVEEAPKVEIHQQVEANSNRSGRARREIERAQREKAKKARKAAREARRAHRG